MGNYKVENFCRDHNFLFHEHRSGTWGADRYCTYYKVAEDGSTMFSVEYFPVRRMLKIRKGCATFQGVIESLDHMMELLAAMSINM